ncbi:penicillin-binding transpeptidase domain-containing protein [Bacillus alkalicellulosilyticus]|uniref:penicillin-binding transpeptidase domain-containing protein n=1 Tax=Alkalihalobacterium alkalicellulosilyticum TaxID=1912214 RepID=UPI0009982C8D|nr:penicillin-binding transpeptidase domain-containing protein [Bacillus alkalicellulosilyticus]
MQVKRATTNKRAVLFLFLFLIMFSVLFGRIVYIQANSEIEGQDLKAIAESHWTKKTVIEGQRGTIYDRNGSPLAQEISSYTMYAVLNKNYSNYVKNPSKTASILAEHVEMPVEKIEELLTSDRFQVEFGPSTRNMSHEKMTELKELELDGIFFRREPRRYYPKQTYASHVIGYTERDMENSRMGLELSLDENLRAEDGYVVYQRDPRGIKLPDPKENVHPPKHGDDVYLTFDSNIQTALEQVMTKVDEEYSPERMIAIVADPKTGQILAMSNRPSFNPNHYEEITNYLNYAVSDRFEPGSTMKVFTLAAAIEEGVYNGEEEYQSGRYQLGANAVSDHNQGRGWGKINFNEGFQRSSNVAFVKLGLEKLGPDTFFTYLNRFGFAEPTGIDLPNEVDSLLADSSNLGAAYTAFGQNSAVTPIQQIQAATAIANNGKMMKPYVIDKIVNPADGSIILANEPEVVGEPVSKDTAKQVRDLLETVVTEPAGTGRPFYIEGFDVIGKTGTAQISAPGGGYLQGHGVNIFSFLGMAPKDDPKVVVYVAVDRPQLKPVESGSAPVSMIFNTVMKHSLQYLNITPTYEEITNQSEQGIQLDNYKGKDPKKVKKELEEKGLEVLVFGNGDKVIDQQPVSDRHIMIGERVLIRTEGEKFSMPDVIGWSFRDVMKLSNLLQLQMNATGAGFTVQQNISPGSTVREGDYVQVELREPSELIRTTEEEENEEETQEELETFAN